MIDDISSGSGDVSSVDEFDFDAEVERAGKNYLDARSICIADWELRKSTEELLEKLAITINKAITRKHINCHCSKDLPICEKFVRNSLQLFKHVG